MHTESGEVEGMSVHGAAPQSERGTGVRREGLWGSRLAIGNGYSGFAEAEFLGTSVHRFDLSTLGVGGINADAASAVAADEHGGDPRTNRGKLLWDDVSSLQGRFHRSLSSEEPRGADQDTPDAFCCCNPRNNSDLRFVREIQEETTQHCRDLAHTFGCSWNKNALV